MCKKYLVISSLNICSGNLLESSQTGGWGMGGGGGEGWRVKSPHVSADFTTRSTRINFQADTIMQT